jgi:multicomponent Na+:H+ antiporter subunit B
MTRRPRLAVFAVGVAGLAALLGWGISGLPAFGHFQGGYGNLLLREAVPERHGTNVVTAIVFDYRGFDTLGEEFILSRRS